jgi:hypothetical protein
LPVHKESQARKSTETLPLVAAGPTPQVADTPTVAEAHALPLNVIPLRLFVAVIFIPSSTSTLPEIWHRPEVTFA